MRLVDHWISAHHFHHEDVVEFEEILKKLWETVLFVTLSAVLIYTLIVLAAPELAYTISKYFI